MKYYQPEQSCLAEFYYQLMVILGRRTMEDDEKLRRLSNRKLRKCREAIGEFCNNHSGCLSSTTSDLLAPGHTLVDIVAFLKQADDDHTASENQRREEWVRFAAGFEKTTQQTIVNMIDTGTEEHDVYLTDASDHQVKWWSDLSESFEKALWQKNPVFSENSIIGNTIFGQEITQTDAGYKIDFLQDRYGDADGQAVGNTEHMVTVEFSGLTVETQCYNYITVVDMFYTPWREISKALSEMDYKQSRIGEAYMNQAEIALLPLSRFYPLRLFYNELPYDKNDEAISLFHALAEEAGPPHIAALTHEYANGQNSKSEKRNAIKLQQALQQAESEPLFRLLYRRIQEAANHYPVRLVQETASHELGELRGRVTAQFTKLGFTGEYPHFKKMSSLRGIRLLEINGQPAWAGLGKHMVSCIDCFEEFVMNQTQLTFVVGTVFLKPDQLELCDALDANSGFFLDKNRRRGRVVSQTIDFHDNEPVAFDVQGGVKIAAKVSQCEKVTKHERKDFLSVGRGAFGLGVLVPVFALTGLIFGIAMCLGFAILAANFVLIFTRSLSEVWSVLTQLPWLFLFLFSSIGFGLSMLVLTLLGQKRG